MNRSYRLTGTRGQCAYLGMTFGTPFGQGEVGGRTGTQTQTHIDEYDIGPNGEVDILIAPAADMPDPRPRNSIVLEPGTAQLAIRETHWWKTPDRLSNLRMELVGEVPPPMLSSDELAPKLEFAAMFLTFVGGGHIQPFVGMSTTDPEVGVLQKATVDFWNRYLKGDAAALGQLKTDATLPGSTTFQDFPAPATAPAK